MFSKIANPYATFEPMIASLCIHKRKETLGFKALMKSGLSPFHIKVITIDVTVLSLSLRPAPNVSAHTVLLLYQYESAVWPDMPHPHHHF